MNISKLSVRILTVSVAAGLGPLLVAGAAQASSKGQLCKAADAGTKATDTKSGGTITCTKDGTRYRWTGTGAAATPTTAAKVTKTTKKTPKTTKAPKVTTTTKAPKTTATTKATTKATKKTKTTAAPATNPPEVGVPVNGRFCKKALDGQTATDASGRTLTCKLDNNGKDRWQVA